LAHTTRCDDVYDLGRLLLSSGGFKGVERWGRPSLPLLAHLFQKAAFFRVKGVYFIVRTCDKWGRSW